eukprot:TRINITY_DN2805_c0_g1_i2.p1 TRINITY_DN2805_c0_g1~~TRINITY_DN2805_c0_g1_i2.p1  ORF type:complete len:236 (+),score=53.49 TRINITY_DN2805_c0_g1_i2:122-829(+)
MKIADSKTLTEQQRENLFEKIRSTPNLGYEVIPISPEELSTKMLKLTKVNLNTISHDAAIQLIRNTLAFGVNLKEIFVDTVGDPKKYQGKLQHLFPEIKIVVSKKADSLFPIVSAASICAKVIRDHELKHWNFKERKEFGRKFGSGYPADPITKTWMRSNLDPVFGFPSVIRFSWKTTDTLLKSKAVSVTWGTDEDQENESGHRNKRIKSNHQSSTAVNRNIFFADSNVETLTEL